MDNNTDYLDFQEERHEYDDATLEMLYKRREDHLKGDTSCYTVEETISFIKQHQ